MDYVESTGINTSKNDGLLKDNSNFYLNSGPIGLLLIDEDNIS